jgi:uncharacterized protein (TIGR04255 family)
MAGKKAKTVKKRSRNRTLPQAPLVEVVFELHWDLSFHGAAPQNLLLRDPTYPLVLNAFSSRIAKMGFVHQKLMIPENGIAVPHSIERRFYQKEDQTFPLMQIGPGIFATNQAADYEWKSFRNQVKRGIDVLAKSLPDLPGQKFNPLRVELRFVNALASNLAGSKGFIDFINKTTNVTVEAKPPFAEMLEGAGELEGRLVLQRGMDSPKSRLIVDIGTASRSTGDRSVKLEIKVVSTKDQAPKFASKGNMAAEVATWLEKAHNKLSPLFEGMFAAEIFKTFGKKL